VCLPLTVGSPTYPTVYINGVDIEIWSEATLAPESIYIKVKGNSKGKLILRDCQQTERGDIRVCGVWPGVGHRG